MIAIAAGMFAASCEKEIASWSGSDRINFETIMKADTLRSYSFFFEPEDITQHTLWVTMKTEGFVRDYPRAVTLKQEPAIDGNEDAVPGVHYVPFDDPQVKAQYVIPAGAATASFPIILLRDASLQESVRTLRIVLEENEHFLLSINPLKLHRNVVFADKLIMPEMWRSSTVIFYFGTYGEAKHRFMIEATGQPVDNDWFKKNFSADQYDYYYLMFLRGWFQEKLDERNAREGSPLKEADGTIVTFV
jgi:hypothetical protein